MTSRSETPTEPGGVGLGLAKEAMDQLARMEVEALRAGDQLLAAALNTERRLRLASREPTQSEPDAKHRR